MDERAQRREAVAVCERTQTEWFRVRAEHLGGTAWKDGPLNWVDGPDGLNLMFPETIELDGVRRGVERARELGRELIGAWLSTETDASALVSAGFDRGWAPWWMAAPLTAIDPPEDPRVHTGVQPNDVADEYEHEGYDRLLELARLEPQRAFYAGVRSNGALAGHAWSFVEGEVAGIFDLDVWAPFRRRGLGAALLHAVCGAAHDAGARTAVLSTTPQGAIIYRAQGFNRIGTGATWWLHLD